MMRRLRLRKGLILLWGVALFAWWIRYYPPAAGLLIFDDDARQHVYWTARFQDSALFPDDLLTAFISSLRFDPIGYQLVYRLGTHVLDALRFSQVLTLVLLFGSLWLLDDLATGSIANPAGRLFCEGLFLFFSLYRTSGGFPRSFAFPLLLSFLVLLQRGSFRAAMITILPQAVLYPPILMNTLVLAGWHWLARIAKEATFRKSAVDLLWMVVVVAAAGVFLTTVYGRSDGDLAGSQVTLQEARFMPEFYPGGRTAFFKQSPIAYFLLGRSGIGAIQLTGFGIILLLIGIIAGFRAVRVPVLAIELTVTSLVLFGVAHLVLFKLHLPSRYTLYTLPLAFMLAIGASSEGFLYALQPLRRRFRKGILRGRTGKAVAWIILVGMAVIYADVQGSVICHVDSQMVALDRTDLEMLSFLSVLPKDTVVAGHPMDMNNVPLVARRKVLANQELSIPYYLGYYKRLRKRLFDTMAAYYATQWEPVVDFARRYGVDVLVIRKERFQRPFLDGRVYFEPFNQAVKKHWKGGERFVLADPPREMRCFENVRYVVLCLGSVASKASIQRHSLAQDGHQGCMVTQGKTTCDAHP